MISVIIAAHNADRWFEECLRSIQAQSFSDFEVIVVDDGSTDQTLAQAQRFARTDARFRTIAKPHTNAGDARNVGLAEATGDYLLFFDADDRMMPTMLGTLYRKAVENDADVVACDAEGFSDETGGLTSGKLDLHGLECGCVFSGESVGDKLFQAFLGWAWNKLFKRSFIEEHGLQFQSLTSTNDAYFVFMALAHAKRIYCTREVLVQHRASAGSIEKSRHKSPHNARLARGAINEALQTLPNCGAFMQSFNNWALTHAQWNYVSLPAEGRAEALDDYLELLQSMGPQDENYFYFPDNRAASQAYWSEGDPKAAYINEVVQAQLAKNAFYAEALRLNKRIGQLGSERENRDWYFVSTSTKLADATEQYKNATEENQRLKGELKQAKKEAAKLKKQVKDAKAKTAELRASNSWKAGRALTYVPRKLKKITKHTGKK